MKKEISNKLIWIYCAPEFAVGLLTAMVANYLIYFYQPSKESGIPTLITQGTVILGVLTLMGFIQAIAHIIDAVTDPLVASWSDKSKNKKGRRIPYMQKFAIPFGLSALLIFCAPQSSPGIVNDIWVAAFMWLYYIFYTLYMIPYNALFPEMIKDQGKLVNAYTTCSLLFVTGSAVGYVTPLIVSGFKSAGLATVWAWRATFAIFTVISVILLVLPGIFIKETDYVNSVRPTTPLLSSLKHAFSNKHFRVVTLGQLFEGTALSFFEACIMYYITSLLELPETASTGILALSIVGSLCMYPFINKWVKKKGKRKPMILGCAFFTVAEFAMCFAGVIPGPPMLIACVFALFVSFPFAVLNIIPSAMMGDVIQYDTINTGVNQEGVFGAARSFVTKVGTSIALMIVPSLTVIGAPEGENIGKLGLKITAIVGGVFCAIAVIIYLCYNEKEILGTIHEAREKESSK